MVFEVPDISYKQYSNEVINSDGEIILCNFPILTGILIQIDQS